MAFFSEEMKPMLDTYLGETSELMADFDRIVDEGEQSNTFTPDDIAELFRSAHTIKSSSAAMGLNALSRLTHHMEDLLGIFREDPKKIQGRVSRVLGHFYEYSDFVKKELARMQDDDYQPAEGDSIYEELTEDIRFFSHPDTEEGPEGAKKEAPLSGDEDISLPKPSDGEIMLHLTFRPDVAMINARAMVIERQISGKFHVLAIAPKVLNGDESGNFLTKRGMYVVFPEKEADEARKMLSKNLYLSKVEDAAEEDPPSPKEEMGEKKYELSAKEKFISLRWENIQELQNVGGGLLASESLVRKIAGNHPEIPELKDFNADFTRLLEELISRIDSMALVRVSSLVPQLNRTVWDMSRNMDREVDFQVEGQEIKIDMNLYNNISEPLLHMIRNSLDHGIEPKEERLALGKSEKGHIRLTVENQGSHVIFRIFDDGRGMKYKEILAKAEKEGKLDKPASAYTEEEALQLIMKPGFSTSDHVTQYSGRGVGMDIVNHVVSGFGGRIFIRTKPGKGTEIAIDMPVSVTAVESLGFKVGPYVCVLPLYNVEMIFSHEEGEERIGSREGKRIFTMRKREIPVLDLHKAYGVEGEENYFIVVRSIEEEFCIGVDTVTGQETASSQPIPKILEGNWQASTGIRNAIIHADGSIGFALNAVLLNVLCQKQGKEE